ncbi:MAG: polyamine aminopropyltransferase [Clostridiales bacterium]|jgi:spermidine synthase|nr:polyamine aminopropyltransferase [Clostridiales bacterium]
MELWFTEKHNEFAKMSYKINRHLYSGQSEFQRIDIFESFEFGRFLTLDGLMMMTEKDEFAYHEMLVHVPMAINPDIKKVLIVGAGDGGVVREAAKYQGIAKMDMVEIDKQVVDVCKQFLPQTASALDDARLDIFFQDGLRFIRKAEDEYDLIIVDSTDPEGPGEGLFTREFYGNCHRALRENGILVNQLGSPYYATDAAAMLRAYGKLKHVFGIHAAYQAHIPTYPSGHWMFGYCAKAHRPTDISDDWNKLGIDTKYYNTELHRGAFALPTYVKEMLG